MDFSIIDRELDKFHALGGIDRKSAIVLDQLMNGELFEEIPKNRFPELYNPYMLRSVEQIVRKFRREPVELSEEDANNMIEEVIRLHTKIEEATKEAVDEQFARDVITSDVVLVSIDGKLTPIGSVRMADVYEALMQIEGLFNTSITKPLMWFHENKPDCKMGDIVQYGLTYIKKNPLEDTLLYLRDKLTSGSVIYDVDIPVELKHPEEIFFKIELAYAFGNAMKPRVVEIVKESK